MKILRIYVDGKTAWGLRVIFVLASIYFLQDIFYSISSGVIARKSELIALGSDPISFYLVVLKNAAFALVFLTLAFYSVRIKSEKDDSD